MNIDLFNKYPKYINTFLKVASFGAAGLTISLFTLYKFQEKLIYHPVVPGLPQLSANNPFGYRSPQDQNLPFENVEIKSEDSIYIRGWFLKQPQHQTSPTVVFFHENAGNLGYRGYSESDQVKISQKGIEKDAKAIINYIFNRQDIDTNQIYTHGRSLGGATSLVAAQFAQQQNYKLKGMILENTFTSIQDVGKEIFPNFIMKFSGVILKNKWESIQIIPQIKVPIQFIKSMRDELVPPKLMQQLYDSAQTEKSQFVIEEGDHNSNWTLDPKHYFDNVSNFIQKYNKNNNLNTQN